jgi:hypothetical protein
METIIILTLQKENKILQERGYSEDLGVDGKII